MGRALSEGDFDRIVRGYEDHGRKSRGVLRFGYTALYDSNSKANETEEHGRVRSTIDRIFDSISENLDLLLLLYKSERRSRISRTLGIPFPGTLLIRSRN